MDSANRKSPQEKQPRRRSRAFLPRAIGEHRRAPLSFTLCFSIFLAGCQSETVEPQGELAIVFSGDTAGWIVPCGCTSNQSGGLARRGTFVRRQREQRAVLVADVGGVAASGSAYDREKFEAILNGSMRMGLAAQNVGTAEAKFGAEYLRDVARRLRIPLVSCNVTDVSGKPVAESHRVVSHAGRKVAFVGVLSDSQSIAGVKIEPPRAAILNLLPRLKGQFDHLIVLGYLPEAELRALASSLPEADAVIGGPTGQSIAPQRSGPTWLAAATNKGKFVVTLTAAPNQRTWSGEVHEMNEAWPDDAEQTENVAAFHRALAAADFSPSDTSFAAHLSESFPADLRVVGSDKCVDCHAGDCDAWKQSKHSASWASLTKTGSHVDSYCQQCHASGYGLAGGFESVARSPSLTAVGCEDCHGPASAHVAEPTRRTPFARQARQRCLRCHDRENSPKFSYDAYWPLVSHGGKKP